MSYLDEGEDTVYGADADKQALLKPEFNAYDLPEDTSDSMEDGETKEPVKPKETAAQYEVVETRRADHPWKPKPVEVVFTGSKEEAEQKLANLERRHVNDTNTYELRKV